MADAKVSALTELAAAPADDDELLVVDKSDTTMAASGTDKRMRYDRISGLWVPKTLIDAKGDLLVGTAADTVGRFAAGTDNYGLVADSSQSSGLNWKPVAGAELGYAEITTAPTSLTGTTSITDISGLSITVTVGTRPIVVEFYVGWAGVTAGSAPLAGNLFIREGTTTLQFARLVSVTTGQGVSSHLAVRLAPTAGSHTYKASWSVPNSANTFAMTPDATGPVFITAREV